MALLSQALHLGYLLSPHSAFQGHAAHTARWPTMLSPNGSSDTCISVGVFHIPMSCFHGALPVYPQVFPHSSKLLHGAAQASGRAAPGRWARTWASWTKRWVRRRSPRSASANSVTAQFVASRRSLMSASLLNTTSRWRIDAHHSSNPSKTKNVSNWQDPGWGAETSS